MIIGRLTPPQRLVALAAALLLLAAACGGDAADEVAPETAETAAEATSPTEAAATPMQTEATEAAATEPADPTTDTTDASTTEPTDGATATAAGATLMVSDSPLGEIVVDGDGRTLYLLTSDSPDESTCSGDCANAWPPLTADEDPTAGEGADESLLGTIEREDGSTQVTYGDWPLYYFQGDAAPGEVNGQGIESFGGVWWVVAPSGEAITAEAETAAAEGGGY